MQKEAKRLLLDLKEGSGCDYHRVSLPIYEHSTQYSLKNDVVVFNRIFTGGIEALKTLRKSGIKVVVDWDDFIELGSDHYLYKTFQKTEFTKSAIKYLKEADAVTVTTEFLRDKLAPYVGGKDKIFVIRNGLPFDEKQFTRSDDYESGTPLVWAGGASHAGDLELVKNTFQSETISLCGYEDIKKAKRLSHSETSAKEWSKIKKDFKDANMVANTKDLSNYMKVYDTHSVAIAPLVSNAFNKCKSNLKVLEAGAKGLPIICSKTLPYFNPLDKDFVSYANNRFEWQSQVKYHLENPTYTRERGEALAEHVREHYNLNVINKLRKDLYESL